MRILIVEDEPASLKLAQLVLATDGNEVTEADAAAKAVEEILRSVPEAILLDLELPGIDGLTLARNLKKSSAMRHIPVIAITAFPERYSRAEAIEAGCTEYLLKPIDTRRLSKQIAQAVENAK